MQVLDPAEETLPYAGRVLFDGLEREGSMLASRAEALRTDYVSRMQAHREELSRLTRAVRWSFTTHHTDSQPQAALLAPLRQSRRSGELTVATFGPLAFLVPWALIALVLLPLAVVAAEGRAADAAEGFLSGDPPAVRVGYGSKGR